MVEIASKTKSICDKYSGIYEAKSIYEINSESSYTGMGIISNYHVFDNYISNQIDELKQTIKIFKQLNEARYTNHEVHNNYNLGIILHGEPETGKTLLIKTIAIELQMGVALVDMRKIKTCKDFQKVINDYYKDFVIVFEEFDFVQGIITNRESTECKTIDKLNEDKLRLLSVVTQSENITKELALIDEKISTHENKLTLDSMLTVLDGVREYKGRVIIATTNLIDKIDPALMRCGRFDIKVELKKYNSDEISMYLSKRYKCDISGKFKPITPADLRQLCVKPMDYVINELTI
jgi:chaperone BCS1